MAHTSSNLVNSVIKIKEMEKNNNKTIINSLILGFKKGWSTPTLPAHIISFPLFILGPRSI